MPFLAALVKRIVINIIASKLVKAVVPKRRKDEKK